MTDRDEVGEELEQLGWGRGACFYPEPKHCPSEVCTCLISEPERMTPREEFESIDRAYRDDGDPRGLMMTTFLISRTWNVSEEDVMETFDAGVFDLEHVIQKEDGRAVVRSAIPYETAFKFYGDNFR